MIRTVRKDSFLTIKCLCFLDSSHWFLIVHLNGVLFEKIQILIIWDNERQHVVSTDSVLSLQIFFFYTRSRLYIVTGYTISQDDAPSGWGKKTKYGLCCGFNVMLFSSWDLITMHQPYKRLTGPVKLQPLDFW